MRPTPQKPIGLSTEFLGLSTRVSSLLGVDARAHSDCPWVPRFEPSASIFALRAAHFRRSSPPAKRSVPPGHWAPNVERKRPLPRRPACEGTGTRIQPRYRLARSRVRSPALSTAGEHNVRGHEHPECIIADKRNFNEHADKRKRRQQQRRREYRIQRTSPQLHPNRAAACPNARACLTDAR